MNDKSIEELKGIINRLRAALDAATDIGVYPASVSGSGADYEKRTEYMEGWNDAASAAIEAMEGILNPGDWEDK